MPRTRRDDRSTIASEVMSFRVTPQTKAMLNAVLAEYRVRGERVSPGDLLRRLVGEAASALAVGCVDEVEDVEAARAHPHPSGGSVGAALNANGEAERGRMSVD